MNPSFARIKSYLQMRGINVVVDIQIKKQSVKKDKEITRKTQKTFLKKAKQKI